jgi:hypothetical protein
MANEAAKDGVCDPGHWSQDGGRSYQDGAQADLGGHTRFGGHGMLDGVVPILLDGKAFACHKCLFSFQLSAFSFQPSAFSFQLPASSFQLSAFSRQLSAVSSQLDGSSDLIFSLAWT